MILGCLFVVIGKCLHHKMKSIMYWCNVCSDIASDITVDGYALLLNQLISSCLSIYHLLMIRITTSVTSVYPIIGGHIQ